MTNFMITFLLLWIFRYYRLIVHTISSARFKPIPLSTAPRFSSKDTTVVIPTICNDKQLQSFRKTLASISHAEPCAIIVVTPAERVQDISRLAANVSKDIKVLSSLRRNKRYQVWLGIQQVETEIVILADDDVEWRSQGKFIPSLLAPFGDKDTGAVGTCQRVERTNWFNICEYLGACYIARRNFETTGSSHIDGGLSCLSGRTQAIRTSIVKDEHFRKAYCEEKWGDRLLNPDDDNLITRWLYKKDWRIQIQSHEDAIVHTTLETSYKKYLAQCIRWERSRGRHTITLLSKDYRICMTQPWSTFALYFQAAFHSLCTELLMAVCWNKCKESFSNDQVYTWLTYLIVAWVAFAKAYKIFGHYRRNPMDIVWFPFTLTFGYVHGIIKYYALLTLLETSWGSRDADEKTK